MPAFKFRTFLGRAIATGLAIALVGCAPLYGPVASLVPGSRYVAMGSSYASGPGITDAAVPKDRCGRSNDNYAHQLARMRGLRSTDVSCGGAATANILGPWGELPPQIDAVTKDTSLVTITIGGNNVGYVGGLIWGACKTAPVASRDPRCVEVPPPAEQDWQSLATAMHQIIREARARAPSARIVLVDYLTVLPRSGTCPDIVMEADRATASRLIAKRLARLTLEVGQQERVDVLRMSEISASHGACAGDPWMSGFPHKGGPRVVVPFHPNLAGMTATAQALDRLLTH